MRQRCLLMALALLLLPGARIEAQGEPGALEDVFADIPADCVVAVKVRSVQEFAGKLADLARRIGVDAPGKVFPIAPAKLVGVDAERSAAFLLFDPPVFGEPPFAFIVPTSDYDAFLSANADAEITRLPSGVDELSRAGAAAKLYAGSLAASRAVVSSSHEVCVRLRDFPSAGAASLGDVLAGLSVRTPGARDVTSIVFPGKARAALAGRLGALAGMAGAKGPLFQTALDFAGTLEVMVADLTIGEGDGKDPNAALGVEITVRPAADSTLARLLGMGHGKPAPPLEGAWTDGTLALASWNFPLEGARKELLGDLCRLVYDWARGGRAPSSQVASPDAVPGASPETEADLLVQGTLLFLESFSGTGGAYLFPGRRPGEIAYLEWEHFEAPTLAKVDRVVELWLSTAKAALARMGTGLAPVYAPRGGEYLGRVSSLLSIERQRDESLSQAGPRGHVFVAGDLVCFAWEVDPDLARETLDRLREVPASQEASSPSPSLIFAGSLRGLALALRGDPHREKEISALAESLDLSGPGVEGSVTHADGAASLAVSLNLNDLALALSVLGEPE